MSWDKKRRGGENAYYYRSVRVGTRTCKRYIGRGPVAEMIARLDEAGREQRRAEREARSAGQLRLAAADLALQELISTADLMVRATLILGGYHDHHGEWRRRRTSRGQGQRRRSCRADHRIEGVG